LFVASIQCLDMHNMRLTPKSQFWMSLAPYESIHTYANQSIGPEPAVLNATTTCQRPSSYLILLMYDRSNSATSAANSITAQRDTVLEELQAMKSTLSTVPAIRFPHSCFLPSSLSRRRSAAARRSLVSLIQSTKR
jgi:hypothetical protein